MMVPIGKALKATAAVRVVICDVIPLIHSLAPDRAEDRPIASNRRRTTGQVLPNSDPVGDGRPRMCEIGADARYAGVSGDALNHHCLTAWDS